MYMYRPGWWLSPVSGRIIVLLSVACIVGAGFCQAEKEWVVCDRSLLLTVMHASVSVFERT